MFQGVIKTLDRKRLRAKSLEALPPQTFRCEAGMRGSRGGSLGCVSTLWLSAVITVSHGSVWMQHKAPATLPYVKKRKGTRR